MDVKPYLLDQHLGAQAKSHYLISGEEPLQRQESLDRLRRYAHAKGYEQRKLVLPEQRLQTTDLPASESGLLFESAPFFEIRLPKVPDAQEAKLLTDWIAQQTQEQLLFIEIPDRLKKNHLNQPWCQHFIKRGGHIRTWLVQGYGLKKWIQTRCGQLNLRLQPDAISLLIQKTEGNLVATHQLLHMLTASYPDSMPIDAAKLQLMLPDASIHTPFDLIDAIFERQFPQAASILQSMVASKDHHLLGLVSVLAQECIRLSGTLTSLSAGTSIQEAMQQNGYRALPKFKQTQLEKKIPTFDLTKVQDSLLKLQTLEFRFKTDTAFPEALAEAELMAITESLCHTPASSHTIFQRA